MPRCANLLCFRFSRAILVLALYGTLIGAWTWRLQSKPARVEEDPGRFERLTRVSAYLSKAPAEVRRQIVLSLALASEDRLSRLDDLLQRPPMEQLRQLTVQASPLDEGKGTLRDSVLLAWLGHSFETPVVESHLMIAASGDRVDDSVKLYGMQILAQRALKEGQTRVAATILERACQLPNATWGTVSRFVNASRAAHRPELATEAVRGWIHNQTGALNTPQIDDARDVETSLMLQAGQAKAAFSRQIALLESESGTGVRERVLERASVCADAASQTARMIPWIEKYLTTFAEQRMPVDQLLEKTDIDPNYRRWLRRLAAIVDTQLPQAQAFDLYLRLSACGDGMALARVCTLATEVSRLEETEQFLGVCLKDGRLRAALIALAAHDDVAHRMVGQWLQRAPKDRDLLFSVAEAEAASKPTAAAPLAWQTFLRQFPHDAEAQRRLAAAHLQARRPDMALRVLDAMDASAMTEQDKRQLAVLRQL